jgi:GTPase SAR1 family protein
MFSLFNGIYDSYLAPTQLNLLIVGPPNAGKSALLERLKVTDIPTTKPRRSSSSSVTNNNNNNNNLGHVEELTRTMYTAFVETGAVDIVGRRRSSIVAMMNVSGGRSIINNSTSKNPEKNPPTVEEVNRLIAAVAAETSTGVADTTNKATSAIVVSSNQPVVTTPRRRLFNMNICPAPKRYSQAAHDQEDDLEENDHKTEQKDLLASFQGEAGTDTIEWKEKDVHESFSDMPQRVRCHSKEFNVDSLDLMNGRASSMQDIPLSTSFTKDMAASTTSNTAEESSGPATPYKQPPNLLPLVPGFNLLQSCSEVVHVKPNAKMLSLMKIRPTSKCRILYYFHPDFFFWDTAMFVFFCLFVCCR